MRGDLDTPTHPPEPALPFTPQEEAFLRAYSEEKSRLVALLKAGFLPPGPASIGQQQALLAQAGALIERAEQLPLSRVASALGADKIVTLARLWEICQSDQLMHAVKALGLLLRVHGLWHDKPGARQQVALIFAEPASAPSRKPVELPFTLPSGDYSVFSPPEADEALEAQRARDDVSRETSI